MFVQVIKSHLTGEIIYTTDVMACAFKLSLSSRKGYYRMSNKIILLIIINYWYLESWTLSSFQQNAGSCFLTD